MEPVASFQGLATGINFRDLVDQIIQAESAPVTRLEGKLTAIDRRATAWSDFQAYAQTVFDRSSDLSDGSLFDTFLTSVSGTSVSVSANSDAAPGSFSVRVDQLATREKLSGDAVAQADEALGLSGEFVVGGRVVSVSADDSLRDIAAALNRANAGASASGVGAAVVAASGGGYRLVLTASRTGAAGIDLRDGADGLLRSLGFLDGTTSLVLPTSDGAQSAGFSASTTAVGTLLGAASAPSGNVTLGGVQVAVDLAGDSLADIAQAINDAVAAQPTPPGIRAEVVSETDAGGNTVQRLDISGTTSFVDENGVLETLGFLQGGHGAVAEVAAAGNAFTAGGSAATASTALAALEIGGTAAGVSAGDTLTVTGTRGDGSTFTRTLTVGTDVTTYGELVDALNASSGGFKEGTRTATASIDADGRLVVTDDQAGDSRLSLSIVANNQGGGSLDFGAFSTTTVGRARQLAAGQDAELDVDGAHFTRSSNTVSDVVSGVTLTLQAADGEEVTVGVDRDVDAIVDGIQSFVKAYNALAEFVDSQFTGAGANDPSKTRPLSGDSVLRSMRDHLRAALETTFPSSVTDVSRLGELGIEINRSGTYDIDVAALRDAVELDPLSVQRLFSVYGVGSTGALDYVYASDATQSGSYDVAVTTLAERASVTGSGFSGTYADDGVDDALSVTDAFTGSTYTISLTDGMTLADIVDALNAELETATQRQVQLAALQDASGNAATDSTALADLHSAADLAFGVATGDTLTLSGVGANGASFLLDWTVTDASTQTLGDLRAEIASLVGSDVEVTIEDGALTVTALEAGRDSFTVNVSSDNAGGGTLDFGATTVVEAGRYASEIQASDAGGQLSLAHETYGSAYGFDVAYGAGGADGSAQLGLAAGSYRGVDVAGTVGGVAATGSGQTLTGAEGSAAEGLVIRYAGSATGAVGSMRFSRGIASLMEIAADALVDPLTGTVKGVTDGLDTQKEGIQSRIDRLQDRLDRRYDFLIKKFSALEEAMARAQQQMSWLQSQLGSLSGSQSQ